MIGCTFDKEKNDTDANPFLSEYTTPFKAPPFHLIKVEHYKPAFEQAMKEQANNIDKIVNEQNEANFKNTIVAFENSNNLMKKVSAVFYNLSIAITTEELQALNKELAPIITNHTDNINLNAELFNRIKQVYNQMDQLDLSIEEKTLLEKVHKNFVRGGANLKNTQKEEFRAMNTELALLYEQFKEKLLNENNSFQLIIDKESDLDGLSETSIQKAAETAKKQNLDNKWIFTIQKPSLLPFLENSTNRDLREYLFNGYINKGDNNDANDTKEIIRKIANIRLKRANLLGYETHAHYILDNNMAEKPENVYALLDELMPKALRVAKQEVSDMQEIANKNKTNIKIQPWDYWYYAAKVKEEKYALNENQIRPYLKLENARDGMFWLANQLYEITFEKLNDLAIYHEDVEVFEVKEKNGDHIGILYFDYFPRASKRSGAWCTSFRPQKYENGKKIAPVVSIVCNFSTPVGDTPALLSVDETKTLFHEFGHALDGLFSDKQFSSLGVPRDFVELPSQIMENWAFEPQVLAQYAKHYLTNEVIPTELVEKIKLADKFNQGFATTEYIAASYLDMDWHTIKSEMTSDVNEFENESMARVNLIDEIVPRYRSSYFQHIFSGTSYSSGYYSYLWAEVLDADAFQAFKETDLFNKELAKAFRKEILAKGGTENAMDLYQRFRGSIPSTQALIERRGLD